MSHVYYELDEEEQALLESVEADEWKTVPDFSKRKVEIQKSAKNQLQKTRSINMRLTERDWVQLKARALEEGIPYQTLAGSVIHKYLTGQIKSVA